MIKKTLIFIGILSVFTATASASYTDVPNSNTYYSSISYLELQGATDSGAKFRPDDRIKKAELFKLIFKIFGEEKSNSKSSSFTDVDSSSWYAQFAELAHEYDLIDKKEKTFSPNANVNKIEAINYLYRMYGIAAPRISEGKRSTLFKDVSVDHPYYSFIKKAIDLGIFEKSPLRKFKPYSYISRGEFANMLFEFDQWYTNESGTKTSSISGVHKSDIFADIWRKILNNYYLQNGTEIDEEALFQAAVKGMVQSLDDPYSVFISGNSADDLVVTLSGEFEGIGVYIVQDEITKKVYITDFVPGSNAKEVGILVGDIIEEVDGTDVAGLGYAEIIRKIKGEAGTQVKLKIRRGTQAFEFNVERRHLDLTLQKGEIIEEDVWYIDINLFDDGSFIEVSSILQELSGQVSKPRAIIIDLRANGGGYLNSALSIAGHFVPYSETLVQLDYGTFREEIMNSGKGEYFGIPLYVFVDGFSASASEILAAALQQKAGAILIGEQTFGKGTAQQINQYWDGSILKLTIAEWLGPDGTAIQGVGISPDHQITGKSSTIDLWMEKFKALN